MDAPPPSDGYSIASGLLQSMGWEPGRGIQTERGEGIPEAIEMTVKREEKRGFGMSKSDQHLPWKKYLVESNQPADPTPPSYTFPKPFLPADCYSSSREMVQAYQEAVEKEGKVAPEVLFIPYGLSVNEHCIETLQKQEDHLDELAGKIVDINRKEDHVEGMAEEMNRLDTFEELVEMYHLAIESGENEKLFPLFESLYRDYPTELASYADDCLGLNGIESIVEQLFLEKPGTYVDDRAIRTVVIQWFPKMRGGEIYELCKTYLFTLWAYRSFYYTAEDLQEWFDIIPLKIWNVFIPEHWMMGAKDTLRSRKDDTLYSLLTSLFFWRPIVIACNEQYWKDILSPTMDKILNIHGKAGYVKMREILDDEKILADPFIGHYLIQYLRKSLSYPTPPPSQSLYQLDTKSLLELYCAQWGVGLFPTDKRSDKGYPVYRVLHQEIVIEGEQVYFHTGPTTHPITLTTLTNLFISPPSHSPS